MAFMEFDVAEELLEDQLLLVTPIIIEGKRGCTGFDESFCKEIIPS